MKKLWMVIIAIAIQAPALADVTTATNNIKSQLGTQTAQDAAATCDINAMTGNNGGNLGLINQFFCLSNTLGLSGATGAAGATKTFAMGSSQMKSHVVITPSVTIGAITYDWEAKVWVCNITAGSTCDQTSQFIPIMYVVWTSSADGGVNKGILAHNFGSSSGNAALGSMQVNWDTGTATTTHSILLNMIDASSAPPAQAINAVYHKTGTAATMTVVSGRSTGGGNRTALVYDTTANTGGFYEDTSGTLNSDTPVATDCFSRVAAAPDWTYTALGTCTGVTSTMPTFQADTVDALATAATAPLDPTVGYTAVTTIGGSPMNGMSAHPANL